ncbi:flagellar hook-associated protein FlgK [Arthrobacter sp. PAMC25284]|uniref:flagellar hook-associated protein FlgK n=1 Tax=Arthrobacter sp. PAMC25284 TaxID=2861279 RepID=UPI001C62622D|nr:flagellar hook-associated protein FlgK [Arthrobacter sp. PAMC25284]QYF91272.1 flagellar hook-associated protein FlgK [Arthrobacter sp. PAMC25284]
MSTFGALNTAYRGLTAAQQGMNVAGQNIANAATEGYTRQRVVQSSIAAPAQGLNGSGRPLVGQGVSVDAIARLGSGLLDSGVRSAGAQAGFASARSSALQGIEGILNEPGDNGISAALQQFWAGWQGVANQPGETAPSGQLLSAANSLAAKISTAHSSLETQWQNTRSQAEDAVSSVNAAATQVAAYNKSIRSTLAAGGSANELIDARAKLTESIARLAGGTVREQADGTVDVHVGGNALVMGDSVRTLKLSGSQSGDSLGSSVQLEWTDRPGAVPAGGQIAGALSVLAPADKGGVIAAAAASYDTFATDLAKAVNAVHSAGQAPNGASGQPFFETPGSSAAKSLRVIPQTAGDIAVGDPASGPKDGSIADRIAQLGVGTKSPDAAWQRVVTQIGVESRGAQQHESLSSAAEISALSGRASQASVSLDEENLSLLTNQHAYQAAARVMSAIDEALDVLINRTGIVGR